MFNTSLGVLRDAFEEMAETGDVPDRATYNGTRLTAGRLTGLLWDCTDTMPRALCSLLDMPHGSTYSQGARAYRVPQREGAETS